jgi:hypothetical protein
MHLDWKNWDYVEWYRRVRMSLTVNGRLECCTRRSFLAACASETPAAIAEYRRGGMVYHRLGRTGMDVSLLSFGSRTDPADRVRAGRNLTVLTPQG